MSWSWDCCILYAARSATDSDLGLIWTLETSASMNMSVSSSWVILNFEYRSEVSFEYHYYSSTTLKNNTEEYKHIKYSSFHSVKSVCFECCSPCWKN